MKKLIASLFLLLAACNAEAVDRYLNTACALNGTGATGPCAASVGGPGAFNTGLSVFWSSIGAGNHLYMARGTTTSAWAGIIVDTGVIIDAYTGDAPGTSLDLPIWTAPPGTFMMSVSGANLTVNNIQVTGSASSALVSTAVAGTVLNNVVLHDNTGTGIGMRFNTGATGGALNNVTIYNIWDDGVGISAAATGTYVITNLTCHHVDLENFGGDCIQAYDGTATNLVVSGGDYTRETNFKQAIRYNGSGFVIIKDKPRLKILGTGQAVSIDGTASLDISSLYATGTKGAPLIFVHNSGTSYISGAILDGGSYGIWSSHATGSLTVEHNTIVNADIAGIYHTTDGAGGTLTAKNNYLDNAVNIYDAGSTVTTVADYNKYGPRAGTFVSDGFAKATLALWQQATSQDAHSATGVDPQFMRGSGADAFIPRLGSSPLVGAGTLVEYLEDYNGNAYYEAPTVGAIEPGSTRRIWNVASAASCGINGDGTVPACATSAGSPGRWRSWGLIDWTKIASGDFLCVAAANADAARLNIQAGNRQVTITGNCNRQFVRPAISTTASNSVVIDGTDDSNVTLDFLDIGSGPIDAPQAVKFLATGANQSNIEVKRIKVTNAVTTAATPEHCIWFNVANGKTFSDIRVHDNEVFACGTAGAQNSDGINIEGVTSGLQVYNNLSYGNYNEGIDISSGGTAPQVHDNTTYANGFSGIKFHCGTGFVLEPNIYNNRSYDNGGWAFIFQDWHGGKFRNNYGRQPAAATIVGSQGGRNAAVNIDNPNSGTCTFGGTEFSGNTFLSDYSAGVVRAYNISRAQFEASFPFFNNSYRQLGAQTVGFYFTADLGNNVTASNFPTWAAAHTGDTYASGAEPAPVYVDPTCAAPGNGSSSVCSGANAPLSGITSPLSNNTYLFKAGTTLNKTTSLSISGQTNVTLGTYGGTARARVVMSASPIMALFIHDSTNVTISNMSFTSTSEANLYDAGIYIDETTTTSGIRLINCEVTGSPQGVNITKNVDDVQIIGGNYSDNTFSIGTASANSSGVLIAGASNVLVQGATLARNGRTAQAFDAGQGRNINEGRGVTIQDGSAIPSTNVRILGNYIYDNGDGFADEGSGIEGANSTSVTVDGNYIFGNTAFEVKRSSNTWRITNNVIVGRSASVIQYGFFTSDSTGLTLANNVIVGIRGPGAAYQVLVALTSASACTACVNNVLVYAGGMANTNAVGFQLGRATWTSTELATFDNVLNANSVYGINTGKYVETITGASVFTDFTLAAWKAAHALQMVKDVAGPPLMRGGLIPKSMADAILLPTSPLHAKGVCYLTQGCIYSDPNGYRPRGVPPKLGVFQR